MVRAPPGPNTAGSTTVSARVHAGRRTSSWVLSLPVIAPVRSVTTCSSSAGRKVQGNSPPPPPTPVGGDLPDPARDDSGGLRPRGFGGVPRTRRNAGVGVPRTTAAGSGVAVGGAGTAGRCPGRAPLFRPQGKTPQFVTDYAKGTKNSAESLT